MYELLIVDDEQYVLDSLAGTYPWDELGIGSVHTASSATEALKILDMHTIDIVISDIRMPGLNGLELVEKIRTTSPNTKCVLLSGYSEFQYAKRAIDSDVEAYLLKPVKEQELMETIGRIVDQIRTEWEEIVSRQRIQYSFNEHLPMLRDMLLNELLRGKPFSANALAKKLDTLQLSLREQEPFTLMVARMERGFEKYDEHDRSLLEFGITNICEEIFAPRFNLWKCKDIYGHLVFVITRRKDVTVENESERDIRKLQEKFAVQLQDNVEKYLHGSISIIISNKGKFPDDLYAFYQKAVSLFRSRTEPSETFFIRTVSTGEPDELQPLRKIQEPPTLTHLLEAGRWEDAEKKLEQIVREVKERKAHVPQLLLEIALMLRFSAVHVLHRESLSTEDVPELADRFARKEMHDAEQLLAWGLRVIHAVRQLVQQKTTSSQRSIIQKISDFVQDHLDQDVSLQTIADHVYLHPAYISKIYKQETGEKISDYIYRLRMEKAAHLLRQTNEKIQDIARKTGYQNPSHFSRVFKKYYQLTPDEFREQETN